MGGTSNDYVYKGAYLILSDNNVNARFGCQNYGKWKDNQLFLNQLHLQLMTRQHEWLHLESHQWQTLCPLPLPILCAL